MVVDNQSIKKNPGRPSWPLDNSAKIYPAVRDEVTTLVFRLGVELDHRPDPALLEQALADCALRYPYFHVHLKKGLLWYRLVNSALIPRLEIPEPAADSRSPCRALEGRPGESLLYRVILEDNHLALEMSHILSDGTGALQFLTSLLGRYAELRLGRPLADWQDALDPRAPLTESVRQDEAEDAFFRYYRSDIPSPPAMKGAFLLPSGPASGRRYRVRKFTMELGPVLVAARARGVSITELLAGLYIHSLQSYHSSLPPSARRSGWIRLEVPVNLRPHFPSRSMRNFTLYAIPELDARLGLQSLEECILMVHHHMRLHARPRQLRMMMSRNVRSERLLVVRMMPRALKDVVMRIAYRLLGEGLFSGLLSNLGSLSLPPEVAAMVRQAEFIPAPSRALGLHAALMSYGGTLTLCLGNIHENHDVEDLIEGDLKELGLLSSS